MICMTCFKHLAFFRTRGDLWRCLFLNCLRTIKPYISWQWIIPFLGLDGTWPILWRILSCPTARISLPKPTARYPSEDTEVLFAFGSSVLKFGQQKVWKELISFKFGSQYFFGKDWWFDHQFKSSSQPIGSSFSGQLPNPIRTAMLITRHIRLVSQWPARSLVGWHLQ